MNPPDEFLVSSTSSTIRKGKVFVVAVVSEIPHREFPVAVSPALLIIATFAPKSVIARSPITGVAPAPDESTATLNNTSVPSAT